MKMSVADYLAGLLMKYFIRGLLVVVGLGLVFETIMQVGSWGGDESWKCYILDSAEEILWSLETGEGKEGLGDLLMPAVMNTAKVWFLSLLLVIGFGLPPGMLLGRLACVQKRDRSGRQALVKLLLVPFFLLIWIPAFALAGLLVFAFIDIEGMPVFELMKHGGQEFSGEELRVAEYLRLLLPAAVVALSGVGWLTREVALILWGVHNAKFVRAAEDRGLSGDRLFYHYVVRNSISRIGGAILILLPGLLGALFLVEAVFQFPGMGEVIRGAVLGKEIDLLFFVGALSAMMVMAGSFLIEAIFGMIDKDTRAQGGVEKFSDDKELVRVGQTECGMSVANDHGRRFKRLKWAWIVILGIYGMLWGFHLFAEFTWLEQMTVLVRILTGASGTLAAGVISSVAAVMLSFSIAGLCGYLWGWRAYCLMAKTHSAMLTLPVMFWIFLALGVYASGFSSMILTLTVVGGFLGVGVVSQWFLGLEFRGWVEAARASGLSRRQIFVRHFIPAVWPKMLSRGLKLLPAMILFSVATDFAALKVRVAGSNRWGGLMAEGQLGMLDDPNLMKYSLLAVWLFVAGFAVLANWAKFEKGDRPGPDIY